MNLSDLLSTPGRFLMLGKCDAELAKLAEAKWSGICVVPPGTWGEKQLSDDQYYGNVAYIEAQLGGDSHFTRRMEGYWVKPLTVREIFDQYGSDKFNIIIINVPMMSRQLWESQQVQVHMPRYHLIPEDGHNEAVVEVAKHMGYGSRVIEGDWLLMAR